MVLHFNEVKNIFQHEILRKWFQELFKEDQNGVVAIVLNVPFEGALHWIVADKAKAQTVRNKFKCRTRVWTMTEVNEYLGCFGDVAKDPIDAALALTREKTANANVDRGGNTVPPPETDTQAGAGSSEIRERLQEGQDRNSLLHPPDPPGNTEHGSAETGSTE